MQAEAVTALIRQVTHYHQLLHTTLIQIIYVKKLLLVFSITSKEEMKELLKPSTPHYDGNKYKPRLKHHIFEEELYLWYRSSLEAPLSDGGLNRYMEVFGMIFPDMVHLV